MPEPPVIRVLGDPALPGPTNMARDESLLGRVGCGQSPPTLRLYGWDPPTVSLGYFQRYADFEALSAPAGTLAVVRRLTGGGAILHDRELTYSLTLPADHRMLSGGPNRLYELAHAAIIDALASMGVSTGLAGVSDGSGAARGPFFCFARRHRYDVLAGGDKLAGSAQRRRRDAVLQHGSMILGNRYPQQPTASVEGIDSAPWAKVRSCFVNQLAKVSGEQFEPGCWSEEELADADALTAKYAGDDWVRRC